MAEPTPPLQYNGRDSDVVAEVGRTRLTLGFVRAAAAFWLSIVVVVGAFLMIWVEHTPEIDTAMVAVIASVVTGWTSYFAHLSGSESSASGRNAPRE